MSDTEQPNMPEEIINEESLEQPALLEDIIGEDPKLAEAFARAQQGLYDTVLLEMWEAQLIDEITGHRELASMSLYENFMTTWPWLGYGNIEKTRMILAELTEESLATLYEAIDYAAAQETPPRSREEVYQSAEDDWNLNRHIYEEVIARWSALANVWGDRWQYSNMRDKPIRHVATAIATARTIGPNGLMEQMRHLANFDFTVDDQERLRARVYELIVEMGGSVPAHDDTEGESGE